jgi:hypothetical protein
MICRGLVVAASLVGLVLVGPAAGYAQSINETADSIDSAIADLQSARDDLEDYQGTSDDDLAGALASIKSAHQTMHSTAISLLIESHDSGRGDERDRTLAALRLLEPRLFGRKGEPPVKPSRSTR